MNIFFSTFYVPKKCKKLQTENSFQKSHNIIDNPKTPEQFTQTLKIIENP